MSKPRVRLPKSASVGEVITIKTLIKHRMESGQRKDQDGNVVPRLIINKFECDFNGTPVFSCDIEPGVSSDPFFEFTAKVSESGSFNFKWTDDNGEVFETSKDISVE
ncbi:MAG: thiosulfate oxidation carrier complex protein SoxZ [Pseudomonadota bacterium]